MNNRKRRAAIAEETIQLLEKESYTYENNTNSLSESLKLMRDGTALYTPSELDSLIASHEHDKSSETNIKVLNCTTFAAAKSLVDDGYQNPVCLNFASAKNPGGGFLSGSQAQEECLARASGLYQSLKRKMDYYTINRNHKSSLYTNHLIYSPSVPVFRDDNDKLLAEPYGVSIITSPAVNAGAVKHRIKSVLSVALQHKHKSIVLGAWGCGVFENNPNDIARWFFDSLFNDIRFSKSFDNVVFAVLDHSKDLATYEAFQTCFENK